MKTKILQEINQQVQKWLSINRWINSDESIPPWKRDEIRQAIIKICADKFKQELQEILKSILGDCHECEIAYQNEGNPCELISCELKFPRKKLEDLLKELEGSEQK